MWQARAGSRNKYVWQSKGPVKTGDSKAGEGGSSGRRSHSSGRPSSGSRRPGSGRSRSTSRVRSDAASRSRTHEQYGAARAFMGSRGSGGVSVGSNATPGAAAAALKQHRSRQSRPVATYTQQGYGFSRHQYTGATEAPSSTREPERRRERSASRGRTASDDKSYRRSASAGRLRPSSGSTKRPSTAAPKSATNATGATAGTRAAAWGSVSKTPAPSSGRRPVSASATRISGKQSSAQAAAMLGVGAGLAAAMGIRNARESTGGAGSTSRPGSASRHRPSSAASGRSGADKWVVAATQPAPASVEATAGAPTAQALRRTASAGATSSRPAATPAPAEPAPVAKAGADTTAAPSPDEPTAAAGSLSSAGSSGSMDSLDGAAKAGATADDSAAGFKSRQGSVSGPVKPPSSAIAPMTSGGMQATASSITATSSAAAPPSDGKSTEDMLRQMQREREYKQRQRLKAFVASPEFAANPKSNTDFFGFGKVLGQGSFGKVRLAWHRLAGIKVAIKSYEKSKLKEPNHWRRVQQEIGLMERMNHPHIIRMLEMIDSPKRIHIVMEYAGGGNLCSYVKQRRRLPEAEARKIFTQVLSGLEYMHDNGIIHRDVKLENILFDGDRDMKLVDFGFSVMCRDPNKRLKIFCGTPSYMAPEIVMRREYLGRPVDVWSLGVLLYACLCGCFPFVAKTYPDLYKKIAQAQLYFPDYMSNAAKDLIRRMLHPDPQQRITTSRIKRHPWAAPCAVSVARELSITKDCALLIADDPTADIYEAALKKVGDLGLSRKATVDAVLGRLRNTYTCVYYLVIHRYGRKRLVAASATLAERAEQEARRAAAAASS